MSKIDLRQLGLEISELKRWQSLYKVLKTELTKIDHWKNAGRGDPIKAHSMIGKNRISKCD
jgi:hypothetical protein